MFLVLRYTHFGFLIISIHAKFGKTYVVDTRYGMRPSDAPESRLGIPVALWEAQQPTKRLQKTSREHPAQKTGPRITATAEGKMRHTCNGRNPLALVRLWHGKHNAKSKSSKPYSRCAVDTAIRRLRGRTECGKSVGRHH
jgi:hypothetical protein